MSQHSYDVGLVIQNRAELKNGAVLKLSPSAVCHDHRMCAQSIAFSMANLATHLGPILLYWIPGGAGSRDGTEYRPARQPKRASHLFTDA
jgi:hypothetical protein